MTLATEVSNLLEYHSELKGFAIESLSFHSQSLFALHKCTLKRNNEVLQIAVKETQSSTMARSESEALQALARAGARVPQVYYSPTQPQTRLILMQFIAAGRGAGTDLAEMLYSFYSTATEQKPATHNTAQFGWHADNFIGTLVQTNQWYDSFESYWLESRIGAQCSLAQKKGQLQKSEIKDLEKGVQQAIERWQLDKHAPVLIHGDLWSGNILTDTHGRAYLIDPSVSYGHPEQDLAMLQLFGGPLGLSQSARLLERLGYDAGFAQRVAFWQIYPLLVHVNIFGSSYKSQLMQALRSFS